MQHLQVLTIVNIINPTYLSQIEGASMVETLELSNVKMSSL